MFSCDYNGWADVPEEEREAIDAFEAVDRLPLSLPAAVVFFAPGHLWSRPPVVDRTPSRKAA